MAGLRKGSAGLTSGTTDLSITKNISDIKFADDFKNLFPRNEAMVDVIAEDIKANGFDKSQPVHIWKEQDVLIDGHHRFYAAEKAGLKTIPCYEHSFDSIESAMEYALKLQTQRRNLKDDEIVRAIEQMDTLKKRGVKGSDDDKEKGKSSEKLAEALGISSRKVEKARAVLNQATEEVKQEVKNGEKSINKAYTETKQQQKAQKEQAEQKIEPPAPQVEEETKTPETSAPAETVEPPATPTFEIEEESEKQVETGESEVQKTKVDISFLIDSDKYSNLLEALDKLKADLGIEYNISVNQ